MKSKNLVRSVIFSSAIITMFAVAAMAQVNPSTFPTTGTATINTTVEPSVQLASYSTATITGGNASASTMWPGATNAASGNAINTVLTFGDVSTNNTTAAPYVFGTMGMMVRSNTPYTIRAVRSGTLPDALPNTGTLSTGDIGMVVHNVNAGGGAMSYPGAATGTINGTTTLGFYGAGVTAAAAFVPASVTDGQPVWKKSLRDIGTSTTNIIQGTRVSNGGDNSNYQNRLQLAVSFAVKPQYYTVTSPTGNTAILNFDIIPTP